jgi:hypothetical protein
MRKRATIIPVSYRHLRTTGPFLALSTYKIAVPHVHKIREPTCRQEREIPFKPCNTCSCSRTNACTNCYSYRSLAKKHARRVALRLGLSRGLIYLVAKPTTLLDDSDQSAPFRQRRYFYYLSGVDEPDCYLTYDLKRDHLILYVPDFDLRHAVWMGHTLTVEEAMKKYL